MRIFSILFLSLFLFGCATVNDGLDKANQGAGSIAKIVWQPGKPHPLVEVKRVGPRLCGFDPSVPYPSRGIDIPDNNVPVEKDAPFSNIEERIRLNLVFLPVILIRVSMYSNSVLKGLLILPL